MRYVPGNLPLKLGGFMVHIVMLTNTSSGELLHSDTTTSSNSCNFTGLTSDTTYTITIAGSNRIGQDVVMNTISSLKSDGKVVSFFFFNQICFYVKITSIRVFYLASVAKEVVEM